MSLLGSPELIRMVLLSLIHYMTVCSVHFKD